MADKSKSHSHKNPLCKMINYCPDFRDKGRCEFAHEKCHFGAKCKNPMGCKFYHPELQVTAEHYSKGGPIPKAQKFDRPVKEVPCRHGKFCNNPQCRFNHDQPQPDSKLPQPDSKLPQAKKVCPQGDSCRFFKTGSCKNQHPHPARHLPDAQNPIGQKPKTMGGAVRSCHEIEAFERDSLCKGFAVGACSLPNCGLSHKFSPGSTVWRVFYHAGTDLANGRVQAVMVKLKRESLLALSTGHNRLGIYQVDAEFSLLRNVCEKDHMFPTGSLSRLFVRPLKCAPPSEEHCSRLIAITDSTMYEVDLLTGMVQTEDLQQTQMILAIEFFNPSAIDEELRIIARSGTGLSFSAPSGSEAFLTPENKVILNSIVAMNKVSLLGKEVMVYACSSGDILIMRQDFHFRRYNVFHKVGKNSLLVTDAACAVLAGGVGYVFVAASSASARESCVIALSLATFECAVVLTFSPKSGQGSIRKLASIEKNLCVGIDGVGVLVYEDGSFTSPVARIPVSPNSTIESLYSDGDSTVLLRELNQMDNPGSFSIYKLNKK